MSNTFFKHFDRDDGAQVAIEYAMQPHPADTDGVEIIRVIDAAGGVVRLKKAETARAVKMIARTHTDEPDDITDMRC